MNREHTAKVSPFALIIDALSEDIFDLSLDELREEIESDGDSLDLLAKESRSLFCVRPLSPNKVVSDYIKPPNERIRKLTP